MALEDRTEKFVFSRKMVPNPYAPNRNPIMDFQAGPPPEKRRIKRQISTWFNKTRPKDVPIGMF